MARRRRERTQESGLTRAAAWATIAATLIGLAALVAAVVLDDDAPVAGPVRPLEPPPARLAGVDMVVRNGIEVDSSTALEITLHNTGGRRVVVDRAQLTLREVTPLPLCFTQGDLPLSNRYGAQLPVDAEPGEVVEVPLHQQLGADRADRFEIGLSAAAAVAEGELEGMHLFEVDVALTHDGGRRPLRLGRALVSLPNPPTATTYYWTDDTPALLEGYNAGGVYSARELFPAKVMDCWRSNTAALADSADVRAARSDELAAIPSTLMTPDYAALEPTDR